MLDILVTGGCGFVGSNAALGLARRKGFRVTVLDNLKRRGSELNLPYLARAGVRFVHGDIRSRADLESVDRCDLILECSAEPSVHAGYGHSPEYLVQTNLLGTINCLEYARGKKNALIFLSTSRVYPVKSLNTLALAQKDTRLDFCGEGIPGCSEKGISEDFPLKGSRSLYGTTKLASEMLIEEYGAMYGLPYLINRCGVIAGPRQMGKVDQGFVSLWLARHYWEKPLSYIGYGGRGLQVRDILHVRDLVDLLCLQIDDFSRLRGNTWNVGGGRANSVSLLELTEMCRELTGKRVEPASTPETSPADIPWYITDNTKICADSGWRPERPVRVLLEDTYEWLQAHARELQPFFTEAGAD
ncbi:MAG: NAD-dependent epimerase/dehydratase family protein [Desulfovibrio sp.]|jgi:CDP-paratose 2-epimerase|nr:NAD-dependent epimerase/dehydratase family protein [Desulfovibrio sp.]